MNELRMFHERYTKNHKKGTKPFSSSTLSQILELLPSEDACNESATSYFIGFENTFRILHFKSFIGELRHFWESEKTSRQEFTSFIPQLAVVVAIMYAWQDAPIPASEEDIRPDDLCAHAEAWLDSLTGRSQLTIATLRTRALLILAQQVRSVKPHEVWKATGALMRSAMVAGLHRDPSEFPDIQIFEGELRRRLWMTIVEMDIEASLIYGMPIMLNEGDFTCHPPSNLSDARSI